MISVLRPPALRPGDTIGIVATSFPLPINEFPDHPYIQEYYKGVQTLHDLGFKTKEAKNLKKIKWWFAGTPEERAADINDMYADPEVQAIIVHEGGQSAIAVLEHIDYNLVRQHPKPFIGFSDITNIQLAMFTKTGLVGFQGPLLTYSLGRAWVEYLPDKREEGLALLKRALTSSEPLGSIKPFTTWECWREGCAAGKLFGGNLSMLASLVGTPYMPKLEDLKGCILFWEIDNTQSYRIEKALYQLKYAGILDVISGMVIGKLPDIQRTAWEKLEEPSPKQIVLEVLQEFTFPILAEVDFGHKTVAIPMPIGIEVKMDAAGLRLEFLEGAVG